MELPQAVFHLLNLSIRQRAQINGLLKIAGGLAVITTLSPDKPVGLQHHGMFVGVTPHRGNQLVETLQPFGVLLFTNQLVNFGQALVGQLGHGLSVRTGDQHHADGKHEIACTFTQHHSPPILNSMVCTP